MGAALICIVLCRAVSSALGARAAGVIRAEELLVLRSAPVTISGAPVMIRACFDGVSRRGNYISWLRVEE